MKGKVSGTYTPSLSPSQDAWTQVSSPSEVCCKKLWQVAHKGIIQMTKQEMSVGSSTGHSQQISIGGKTNLLI